MSGVGLRGMNGSWKTYKDVRIGVYAICADEPEGFIDRWLESMSGADKIYVLVTKEGNANTNYLLRKRGQLGWHEKLAVQEKEITPWRFDVARNESLKLIDPSDVDALICTDIDEILIEDFWDDYRQMVYAHPDFDRIFYKYAWSHDAEGNPSKVFWYDKTHQQEGWEWEFPVHETLCKQEWKETSGHYYLDENKIYLHHYPDESKSRGSYLSLLELRVKENPDDLYGIYYLAREYGFYGLSKQQAETAYGLYFKLIIQSKTNPAKAYDLLSATCLLLGKAWESLHLLVEAIEWYARGAFFPCALRENFIRLAQCQIWEGQIAPAEDTMKRLKETTFSLDNWKEDSYCWRPWKENQILADICMWKNDYRLAACYMSDALKDLKTEDDKGIAANEGFYTDLKFLQDKLKEDKK